MVKTLSLYKLRLGLDGWDSLSEGILNRDKKKNPHALLRMSFGLEGIKQGMEVVQNRFYELQFLLCNVENPRPSLRKDGDTAGRVIGRHCFFKRIFSLCIF